MPSIITAILGIFSNIVSGVTEEQKEKLALALQQNEEMTTLLAAQASIDAAEASSPNLFVCGWRPAVAWICTLAFAWVYLVEPIVVFSCTISGHPLPPLPTLATGDMMTVLMGLLGLGGMRTWEKITNVSNKH